MKKYFLLILISFLSYANVFSQTAIDSALNNMNVDSIHDSTKIYKLYRAASSFAYENPDSSNKLLDIGLDYLQNSNQLFKTDSNLRVTKDFFRGYYYNLKGICFYLLNRERECLENWLKTEKIAKSQNDTSFMLRINNNIAIVYSTTGREKEALKIFTDQKEIYETKKDTAGIITSSINMSTLIKNKDSIILLLNNALNLAQESSSNDHTDYTNIFANLAGTYLDTNSKKTFSLKKAKACLDSLILFANEQSDVESKILYYGTISEYYMLKNQYNLALKNAKKGAELSKQMTGLTSPELLSKLYEIHKKLKNYKKANLYLEEMVENKDSLEKLSAKEDITKYESEKEFEIQQKLDSLKYLDEIKIQQAETKAKEEEIKTQKIIEGVLFVGILLVIGFLGFVYKQLNTTKKQKVVIEEKQQEISDSINYAKRIQDAMMTSSVYLKDTLPKSFIFFKPKDVVSGDFYWIYKDQEDNIFFTVADCTGHGVPGAFMSMIGTSLLNEIIIEKEIKDTDKILHEMRAQIIKSLGQEQEGAQKDGMDISLCKLNMKNKTVEFSGAHNSLVHVRDEELKTYRGDHQPVGLLLGDKKPFTKHKVKLKKNDMLYIYSDGYQDQFGGEKGKKYMAAKFKNQLLKISKETEDQQLSLLDKEFSSWIKDYEQVDDVCVMGVRII
jgi:serine phosphatase RsbU (regulator of sigma subunit)